MNRYNTPLEAFKNQHGIWLVWYDTKDRVYVIEDLITQADVYGFIDELYLKHNIRRELNLDNRFGEVGVFETTNNLVKQFLQLKQERSRLLKAVEVLREGILWYCNILQYFNEEGKQSKPGDFIVVPCTPSVIKDGGSKARQALAKADALLKEE